MDIDQIKHAVRKQVWDVLEQAGAVPPGVHGRIPAFHGATVAAQRLAELPVWKSSRVIKAVPDKAQLPVRARALTEGKLVYMAAPKLAKALPFYLLDPATLTTTPNEAASSKVAATVSRNVGVDEMQPVDLIVCGSVAVNRRGVRLGKGAGYSDIEVALLQEAGPSDRTPPLSPRCTRCKSSTTISLRPHTTSAWISSSPPTKSSPADHRAAHKACTGTA